VTERERRLLAEQLTQSRARTSASGMIIKGAQLSPQQQEVAVNRSGPVDQRRGPRRAHDRRPAVRDDLRRLRRRGDARDGVQGGRPRDRKFLGTLVVDTVEPNESTGRLSGPKSAIKPGVEVRTQL
jgi:hypothetical protein